MRPMRMYKWDSIEKLSFHLLFKTSSPFPESLPLNNRLRRSRESCSLQRLQRDSGQMEVCGKRIEPSLQQRGVTGQKCRETTQVKSIRYTIHQQLVLTEYFHLLLQRIGNGMSREQYCAGNCFTVMEIAKERSWACQKVL